MTLQPAAGHHAAKTDLPRLEPEILRARLSHYLDVEIGPQKILQAVAEESGVTLALLLSARRDRKTARPRQLAMYLMRGLILDLSLARVGQIVGGRDHKTVAHACELMDYLLSRDTALQDLQSRILQNLLACSADG